MGTWSLRDIEREESAPASQERFVWPPAAPVRDAGRDAPVMPSPGMSEPRTTANREWIAPAKPTPPLAVAQAWSQIEHEWLDVVAAPLAERMIVEKWRPDSLADYCPRCGQSVGRDELIDDQCEACRAGESTRPPWQRIIRLGEYSPPLSDWIREVKFTRWRRLGRDLGRLLGDSLAPEIAAARLAGVIPDPPPLIVPVPMSLGRRLLRGIDHTVAIARGVADRTGGRIVQPIRRDHRPSQVHVAPSRREANVANSIHPRMAWMRPKLAGKLILVVDDVSTTTSTLRGACRAVAACAREERQGGTEGTRTVIWGAVLARTPPDAHDLDQEGEE